VETLKVSSKSHSKAVAGAMALLLEKEEQVCIQAIGAGAVNQAVKAIAIARGFLSPKGIDIYVQVSFVELNIEHKERTGIKFLILTKKI
jgi:stage V sporulation protein S